GDVIAVWNRLDVSGLSASSTSEEVQAILEHGGDLVFARYEADTGLWSAPELMYAAAGTEDSISLHRTADGDIVATWLSRRGGLTQFTPQADIWTAQWSASSDSWSAAQFIAGGDLVGAPSVNLLGGQPIVVWSEMLSRETTSTTL